MSATCGFTFGAVRTRRPIFTAPSSPTGTFRTTVPWAAVFEKRKHKIFARNAKLSKLFTRIGKEIAMAVKVGAQPGFQLAAEMAIQNARGMNMPKDNVDRAIKKAAGGEGADYARSPTKGMHPAVWPSSWMPPPTT
jgi:hypothetical protein